MGVATREQIPVATRKSYLRLAQSAERQVTVRSLDQKLDVVLEKLTSQLKMLAAVGDPR